MRNQILGAMAQRAEPEAKRRREIIIMIFLPNISAAFPANGMTIIQANWLMLNIQPAWTRDALKEEVITGKATETAVELIPVKTNPRLIVTKTRYEDIFISLHRRPVKNEAIIGSQAR
jgi:hypothetical protein